MVVRWSETVLVLLPKRNRKTNRNTEFSSPKTRDTEQLLFARQISNMAAEFVLFKVHVCTDINSVWHCHDYKGH